MNHSNKISIIITAAGSSTRIGGSIKKEYLPLKSGTVISTCALTFLKAIVENKINIDKFIITFPKDGIQDGKLALQSDLVLMDFLKNNFNNFENYITFLEGGTTRQNSVFRALDYIKSNGESDYVLIHDGARPFVKLGIINSVLEKTVEFGACVPGISPTDTIKQIDENNNIVTHLKRNTLLCVQTPQGFDFNKLYESHLKAQKNAYEYTDDAEIFGQFAGEVKTVLGSQDNIKITYPQDLEKLKEKIWFELDWDTIYIDLYQIEN